MGDLDTYFAVVLPCTSFVALGSFFFGAVLLGAIMVSTSRFVTALDESTVVGGKALAWADTSLADMMELERSWMKV